MPETTRTSTPRTRKPSNDFTGKQAADLRAQAAQDKRVRDEQAAAAVAEEKNDFDNTVFDMTTIPGTGEALDPNDSRLANVEDTTVLDEVVVQDADISLADDSVIVRVNEDIENMTFGYGNNYQFKTGGRYRVPRGLAQRLEQLNLVWH